MVGCVGWRVGRWVGCWVGCWVAGMWVGQLGWVGLEAGCQGTCWHKAQLVVLQGRLSQVGWAEIWAGLEVGWAGIYATAQWLLVDTA